MKLNKKFLLAPAVLAAFGAAVAVAPVQTNAAANKGTTTVVEAQLKQEKTVAKDALQLNTNLPKGEVTKFNNAIKDAKTVDEVRTIVADTLGGVGVGYIPVAQDFLKKSSATTDALNALKNQEAWTQNYNQKVLDLENADQQARVDFSVAVEHAVNIVNLTDGYKAAESKFQATETDLIAQLNDIVAQATTESTGKTVTPDSTVPTGLKAGEEAQAYAKKCVALVEASDLSKKDKKEATDLINNSLKNSTNPEGYIKSVMEKYGLTAPEVDPNAPVDAAWLKAALAKIDASNISAADKAQFKAELSAAKTQADAEKIYAQLNLDPAEPTPEVKSTPMYRVYNENNGEHLFTASEKEYNELVAAGWDDEGTAWNAPESGAPVMRVYNENSGEHFYTTSAKEYLELKGAGWTQEGVVFFSDVNQGVAVLRAFNPNAEGAGSHLFTTSDKELGEVTTAGWTDEGTAFYGVKVAE